MKHIILILLLALVACQASRPKTITQIHEERWEEIKKQFPDSTNKNVTLTTQGTKLRVISGGNASPLMGDQDITLDTSKPQLLNIATAGTTGTLAYKIEYKYDTIPVYLLIGYDACEGGRLCGSGYSVPYTYTVRGWFVNRKQVGNFLTIQYNDNPIAILNEYKNERVDLNKCYIIWDWRPRRLTTK